MTEIGEIIALLLAAARPREEYPSGELDRKREQQVNNWKRLHCAGMIDDEALKELIETFDSGLDYQRDHPLNAIDETLDAAMALARNLEQDTIQTLAGVLDDSVRRRLYTYSVRCASRSLSRNSGHACKSGLVACLLASHSENIDARDLTVSLAPLHVAAQETDMGAGALFEAHIEFAYRRIRETILEFGRREEVTLRKFGWTIADSNPVPWIVWAD